MLKTLSKVCLTIFIFSLFNLSAFSETYIRFNQAGYFPNVKKRIIVCSDENLKNKKWSFSQDNKIILEGTINAPKTRKSEYTAQNFNYEILFTSITKEGNYDFNIEGILNSKVIKVTSKPFKNIKFEILKAIRARRSGSTDAIVHKASHLGDSSCFVYTNNGKGSQKENFLSSNLSLDVLGGWYDAGDYIKFTLTNAYTTHKLLQAYNLKTEAFQNMKESSSTQYNDLLDEAVFGLQYLEKVFPNENTFIIQVGDEEDHEQGNRLPEDDLLNGKRKAYAAFSKPQMALTIAALALGANTMKQVDPIYSKQLQDKAITLYKTMNEKGVYSVWYEKGHEEFYKDENYKDNAKLAALELYKLTENDKYLDEAQLFSTGTSYWSSWGELGMTASNVALSINKSQYHQITSSLDYFKTIVNAPGNIWDMPHNSTWGTLYSYFGVANAALGFQITTKEDQYESMGLDVIDYTMGLNNWGKAFIYSNHLKDCIKQPYAQLYKVSSHAPIGEIAEGPTTEEVHNEQIEYFEPPHDPASDLKKFNTPNLTFYDQPGDYACMETIITGLADGFFLLTQADALFGDKNNEGNSKKVLKGSQGSITAPNSFSNSVSLDFSSSNVERCSIFDKNGTQVISIRPHGSPSRQIDISTWNVGTYTTVKFLKNGKTEMESFEKI